ncbi:hypothetical protein LTR17_016323 [Elasticomyces elasticus]|nr:hypothetical protein LTR17_016323 [Elasticomyces elasticus]
MSPNTYRNNIIPLEKSLGFNFSRGLSRTKGRRNIPIIAELEDAYNSIIATHRKHSRLDVLPNAELEASADRAFDLLGPRLWPTPEEDTAGYRFQWLADASQNDLSGRYPKNLYFACEQDRQQLRQAFSKWVKAKCFCFERNHPEWTPCQMRPLEAEGSSTLPIPISDGAQDALDPDYDPRNDGGSSRAPRSFTSSRKLSRKRKHSPVDQSETTDDDATEFLVEAGLAEGAHDVSFSRKSGRTRITATQPKDSATAHARDVSSDTVPMISQSREHTRAEGHSRSPQSVAPSEPSHGSRPIRAAALKKLPTYPDIESDEDMYDREYVVLHPNEIFHHTGKGWYLRGPRPCAQAEAAAEEPSTKWCKARESASPTAHSTTDATTSCERIASRPAALTLPSESQLPADVNNNHSPAAPEPPAALKRVEAEIDWANPEEFPSFVPLASCHSMEDFFTLIDQQRSPTVQRLPLGAVKVKHVNFETGKGKNASCRITRLGAAGSETFRIMLERLEQYDGDSELKLTVEWA